MKYQEERHEGRNPESTVATEGIHVSNQVGEVMENEKGMVYGERTGFFGKE